VNLVCHKPPSGQVGGGPRGSVLTFSRRSRRSLMQKVASTADPPRWMVTLTYQGWPTWAEAKADLKVWSQAFARVSSRAGVRVAIVWRAEATKEGRPHFHLLIWESGHARAGRVDCLHRAAADVGRRVFSRVRKPRKAARRLPSRRWSDMLGAATALWVPRSAARGGQVADLERRAVDVREIRNERQAVAYCAKYLSKVGKIPQIAEGGDTRAVAGRHWGRSGDRSLLAPTRWATMEVPNATDRIEGLVQTLQEAGREVAAGLVADRVARVVLFGLGDVLAGLWEALSLWAVPLTRPPPRDCGHPRCSAGTLVLGY